MGWCLLYSFLLGTFSFFQNLYAPKFQGKTFSIVVPSIILAPIIVILFYVLFGQALVFPSLISAFWYHSLFATMIPAFILGVAGGVFHQTKSFIHQDIVRFKNMTFYLHGLALGLDSRKILFKIVVFHSLISAWAKCLPWIFGEMFVVEAVFNIPGIGYRLWLAARDRDFYHLCILLFIFVSFYLVLISLVSYLNSWVGRKLEAF
tara:strand:- start:2148 stop:2762 length:615 start_codon:yes stop_codon:yes gene_type:complete